MKHLSVLQRTKYKFLTAKDFPKFGLPPKYTMSSRLSGAMIESRRLALQQYLHVLSGAVGAIPELALFLGILIIFFFFYY
jgi:hypothetical protein